MNLLRNNLGSRTTAEQCLRGTSLAGKTAIVTGANSGIGTETARVLALAGANVVMACRNVVASEEIAAGLRASLPSGAGALSLMPLDLGNFASVRAFAAAFLEKHPALHLLVNNAGIMNTPLSFTADGYESQMGTNHLGHFLLGSLLLDRMKASAPARVVAVSSGRHRSGTAANLLATLDSDRKYASRTYDPTVAYGDSKLANVVYVRSLAARLKGAGVLAFSLHPGVIPTGLTRHMGAVGSVFRVMGKLFLKSVPQGAATTVFAATAPELTEEHSGIYLSDCNEAVPSPAALDSDLAEKLWALSERAVTNADR